MGTDHWDGTHKYWAEKYLAELQEARAQLAAARKKLAEAAHILRGLLGETKRVRAERDALRARVAELEGALFRIAEHKHEECDADTVNAIYPGQCLAWAEIQAIQALGPALDAALKGKP